MSKIPALAASLILFFASVLCVLPLATNSFVAYHAPKVNACEWREDLQFAVDTFWHVIEALARKARQQFRNAIAELQKTVDGKTDDQIIVQFAKAVALARMLTTRLYLLRTAANFVAINSSLGGFLTDFLLSEQPRILQLLGAKISRIGGAPSRA